MEFPFPCSLEQTQIIHRVEELFTFADQIEQQVKNAQERVNNLTQSILAKAFRGELTAQWRKDNPGLVSGENSAESLLARILGMDSRITSLALLYKPLSTFALMRDSSSVVSDTCIVASQSDDYVD